MPSVSPLLKSNLPHETAAEGSRWHCATPEQAHAASNWARQIDEPAGISPGAHLKQENRRLVFRSDDAVLKAFPFRGIRRWTGRNRYARSECLNLLEAAQRGIPVPRCWAYGERPSFGGLRWSAAALQYLPAPTLRDAWLAQPDAIDIEAALTEISDLAAMLYHQGVNHIDFGPHAIIVVESESYLIDWQYASFLLEPNPLVFASQIGYFAWATATNRSWATPQQMRRWFEALWETHQIPSRDRSREVFEKTMARRHSIKERLRAERTFGA